MSAFGIRTIECLCGVRIMMIPSGSEDGPERWFADIIRASPVTRDKIQIVELGQGWESFACENCGHKYEPPPAEVLDLDRTEFGRWLKETV